MPKDDHTKVASITPSPEQGLSFHLDLLQYGSPVVSLGRISTAHTAVAACAKIFVTVTSVLQRLPWSRLAKGCVPRALLSRGLLRASFLGAGEVAAIARAAHQHQCVHGVLFCLGGLSLCSESGGTGDGLGSRGRINGTIGWGCGEAIGLARSTDRRRSVGIDSAARVCVVHIHGRSKHELTDWL